MKKEKNSELKQTSKEDKLNHIEKKILRLLYQAKAPLTTYEVGHEAGISFPTAKKYIDSLKKKKLIIEE